MHVFCALQQPWPGRLPKHGCAPISYSGDGAMGRLLALLLIVVGLMVPTAGGSSARTDTQIETRVSAAGCFSAPSTAQVAAPSNAKCLALPCRGCMRRFGCAYAVACSACGAAANALPPVTNVLATPLPTLTGPSAISPLRDHHRPPDPPRPRPIVIS